MSDTPRTNAQVQRMIDAGQSAEELEHFARRLERELNAANERIARLYAALEECDEAFAKFSPDADSRYGKAWASARYALRKVWPFEPAN